MVKVIWWKMLILLPGHQFNSVWLAQGQGHKLGQGHLKVKVIPRSNCTCLTFYWQAEGGPSTERHSCYSYCCLSILEEKSTTATRIRFFSWITWHELPLFQTDILDSFWRRWMHHGDDFIEIAGAFIRAVENVSRKFSLFRWRRG